MHEKSIFKLTDFFFITVTVNNFKKKYIYYYYFPAIYKDVQTGWLHYNARLTPGTLIATVPNI